MQVSTGRNRAVPADAGVPARWAGPVTSAWFNRRPLAEALGGLDGEARLTITRAPGPAQITPADDGDRYRVLVMPARAPA